MNLQFKQIQKSTKRTAIDETILYEQESRNMKLEHYSHVEVYVVIWVFTSGLKEVIVF